MFSNNKENLIKSLINNRFLTEISVMLQGILALIYVLVKWFRKDGSTWN